MLDEPPSRRSNARDVPVHPDLDVDRDALVKRRRSLHDVPDLVQVFPELARSTARWMTAGAILLAGALVIVAALAWRAME